MICYANEIRPINPSKLPEDVSETRKEWSKGNSIHPRRCRVAVYADEHGNPINAKRLTLKTKFKDPLFLSWPMTTKTANSIVRHIQLIMSKDASSDRKIFAIWRLSEINPYVEWV
jgi:hypothetical protein